MGAGWRVREEFDLLVPFEGRREWKMAFRDLVMGGAGCAVPGQDGSSSSNPLGGLADSIIGSASKTQVSWENSVE